MKEITEEKLAKYFDVTGRAKQKVWDLNKEKIDSELILQDCMDMIERYYRDARHFQEKGDFVNAFAALNYAHGWLDCIARLKLVNVDGDSVLFTVDETS